MATEEQARDLKNFRRQVAKLWDHSSITEEQRAIKPVHAITHNYREQMVSRICPCTPVAGECDLGTAGIFLQQETVKRPLAKRRPQNA